MATLKISTRDKNLREILKIIEDNNLPYELKKTTITLNASNPDNNEGLAKIMEAAEDYNLSNF